MLVLQATPQPLQLVGLVFRFVSQPLLVEPSQLPKPELHVMPHVPPLQDRLPLVELQTVVQFPQCVTSVPRFVSQPGATLSQSPNPRPQVIVHTRLSHEAAPFKVLHARPHAPQCAGVEIRFVSQPLATLPSQSPQSVLQVMPQAPLLQNAVPLFELHTRVQAPQLAGSLPSDLSQPLLTSASQLPQPASQAMLQAPPAHDGVP